MDTQEGPQKRSGKEGGGEGQRRTLELSYFALMLPLLNQLNS
jgi:hypothetical protein